MRVSYWLIPASPHREHFTWVIRELAAKFAAPVFTPHLTIYSSELTHAEAPAEIVKRIARELKPLTLHSVGISFSNEFTKTLFVEFAAAATLATLSEQLKLASAMPTPYKLKPHLSLVYASLPEAVKCELVCSISAPRKVTFDLIQAVATGDRTVSRRDVESWRLMAERSVGGHRKLSRSKILRRTFCRNERGGVSCSRVQMEKITYTSLANLGEDFHRAFEAALVHERKKLGETHPMFIQGKAVKAANTFGDIDPAHPTTMLGKFQSGGREHVKKAIAAAKTASPFWRELGWPARVNFLRKAAELMTKHQFELAALLTLEVGKNRFEAIAEVSEATDLILYYCQQLETYKGYEMSMGGGNGEKTKTVLKPYGVFAVVSPFNFPLALATGMAAAALIAGNTVVFKPASDTPFTGLRLYELLHRAGIPVGVFNYITGSGSDMGPELIANQDLDGMVFTGSREAGMEVLRDFQQQRTRPCICEMGGKNACIVMPTANIDDAAEGIMRSAFGMGGEKCSACSRIYVHQSAAKQFMEALVAKTRALKIGDPAQRETFLGPLINESAVERYDRGVKLGKKDGELITGGKRLKDLGEGHFVEPTILANLTPKSKWFDEEFFSPIVAVNTVKSLDDGIQMANASGFGLTAGIFTQIEDEQREFFERIEAGTTYCNRRGGATTGAWPGVQSFGGWKGSGSSGKNALGPWYVPQFLREQSQTLFSKT
ncbi:MAG TPA: aldehyde dehydrogenase family protein [Candidatus Acidoferrum sp.]|nr:aldehyde dehydrogenase family protein [Candidatus Acidoferrum sp.]